MELRKDKGKVKVLSFALIIALMFTLPAFGTGNDVYGDSEPATIDLAKVEGDVVITRSGTMICASTTSGSVLATGPALAGISIHSSSLSEGENQKSRLIISGEGANKEKIKINFDNTVIERINKGNSGSGVAAPIDDLPYISLTNGAIAEMTIKENCTVSMTPIWHINHNMYSGIAAGVNVPSDSALEITGSGMLYIDSKGVEYGAAIGGNGGLNSERDKYRNNGKDCGEVGSDITIGGNVTVDVGSKQGAGIGGGAGYSGMTTYAIGGDGENIRILGNATVIAKSVEGSGIGGGMGSAFAFGNNEESKLDKGIGIGGDGKDIFISDNAKVTALSEQGAGIGGGMGKFNQLEGSERDIAENREIFGGDGKDIFISDNAEVNAKSGYGGGVGGGSAHPVNASTSTAIAGNCSNIKISGNAVVDAESMTGPGIGGGSVFYQNRYAKNLILTTGALSNISIEGGFVTAKSKAGEDIGTGSVERVYLGDDDTEIAITTSTGISDNIFVKGGSLYTANDKWGCTPVGVMTNNVYKVRVPDVDVEKNSLIGHRDIAVPLISENDTYEAKTISDGSGEHGDSFPSNASAYIYLPEGDYKDITVGNSKKAIANVKETPKSSNDNVLIWEQPIVSFDKNTGDELTFSTKSAVYDEPYGEFPVTKKAGHTLKGWYTKSVGGDKITEDSIVKNIENHTLYAQWEVNKYTVSLNVNGGENLKTKSVTVSHDGKYGELPTPDRTGYNFNGWYTKAKGGTFIKEGSKVTINKDHTLYAQWTAKNYTITFMGNKGKIKKKGKYKYKKYPKKVKYNSKYGTLPKAKREGYKLKGWYTKKNGGKKISKNTRMVYTKNKKMYARWTKNGKIRNCYYVHVRSGPSKYTAPIKYLKKGAKVSVIGEKFGWYKVKIGKKIGYIDRKYVVYNR